jgi:hypothetical protein
VDNLGTQDYAYNANGQLATAGVNGYGYDVDGRLNTVTKSGSTVTLSHDAYFKITVKAARRSVEKNTNQWKATLGYAQYNNNHQFAPITLFFTFYGNRSSQIVYCIYPKKSYA